MKFLREDRTVIDRKINESEIRSRIQADPGFHRPRRIIHPAFHTCRDRHTPCLCAMKLIKEMKRK